MQMLRTKNSKVRFFAGQKSIEAKTTKLAAYELSASSRPAKQKKDIYSETLDYNERAEAASCCLIYTAEKHLIIALFRIVNFSRQPNDTGATLKQRKCSYQTFEGAAQNGVDG